MERRLNNAMLEGLLLEIKEDVTESNGVTGNKFEGPSLINLQLKEQLTFETLIADLLARFLNVQDSQIDAEIEDAIRRIAEFLGLDQGLLVQWADNSEQAMPTHSWTVSGGLEAPSSRGTDVVPWTHRQSVLGKIVKFSCLEDLPQEAQEDKEFFRISGRKSLISLPLKINGSVAGSLIFASLHAKTVWADEVVRRLQVVADVFSGILDRKKSKEKLDERLRFETLLAELSARFINVPPEQVDREIEDAQRRVCENLDLDLSALWQCVVGTPGVYRLTHLYRPLGGPPKPEQMDAHEYFPWCRQQLLAGNVVAVSSMDKLPPEAARDLETYLHYGIKATLTLPLSAGGGMVMGFLSFNNMRTERTWSEALVQRFQLVGQIFANALARKRSDEILRESEERLSLAADSADTGLWVLDCDSRLFWTTERAREIFGYSPDEVISMGRFVASIHPDDREFVRDTIERSFHEHEPIEVEYRIVLGDGGVRWIASRGRSYFKASGGPDRLMGLSIDFTERKHTEEELKNSISLLKATLESTADGILVVDNSGKIKDFNEQFSRLWNIPPEIIEEKNDDKVLKFVLGQLMAPDQFITKIRELNEQPDAVDLDVLEFKDGRVFERYSQPQKIDGNSVGRVWSFRDITAHMQAKQKIKNAYEEIRNLKDRLEAENIYLREEINKCCELENIIGQSDVMKYVFFRVQQVAPTDTSVLITGETGTGKGLVAKAIHKASKRCDRTMVTVNCAALPAGLIESELFGRDKGAFTGSHAAQLGRFDLANKGTIFLDEIGDLPLDLQSKLLRVVEDGEFERLGNPRTIKVDVRIIASTNHDLKKEVQEGRFREDLFYRLNVFPLTMPPLRQRKEDIPLLVKHFVEKYNKIIGKDITVINTKVMKALKEFPWPGNIRELENVIERAVISTQGNVLQLAEAISINEAAQIQEPEEELADFEKRHILKVLKETLWKIEGDSGAARILGLKPSTLRSRMKKLGIRKEKYL